MGFLRIRSFLFLTGAILLSSCSVKEDRSGCPCLLAVDLSQVLDAGITPPSWWDCGLRIVLSQDGVVLRDPLYSYEEAQPEYEYPVPKGETWVMGLLGLEAGSLSGSEVRYPEGCQSDRLYVSHSSAPCDGEDARTVLEMHKQFSHVEILGLESFDYRMEVTAPCSGLDLRTCQALEGRFRYTLTCGEDGTCHFRLPRQNSDDVLILLYGTDGHLDNAIPLGEYLTEIGYDWDALSLADVSVRVDFVTASVGITVGDWTQVIAFPYTL